ncbi:MAG TPA: hypothetical protein VEY32_10365, partial [Flavisolibacter sp.]|nr:hypothetical protein [Flavisolibacter sp.]
MKRILFCLLLLTGYFAQAQVYNNEWIDHTKTYHKFKVGKTGVHRIPQSVLANAGLSGTPAEYFQLWRNGVQVPIFTSQPTGILSSSDYIEFWGEMNDGKPDKELYRLPDFQLNDKWSLSTDTSVYFLTVHAVVSGNLRLANTSNNIGSNTLPAESYFMHKAGMYYRNRLNRGRAEFVGELLYSSSYDRGEGWSSNNVGPNATNSFTLNNLFLFSGGPSAKVRLAVSGNSMHARKYKAMIDGDSVLGNFVNYFNYSHDSTNIQNLLLNKSSVSFSVQNISGIGNMVIHQFEITYPRQFNFGNANNFEFTL